MRSHLLILLQLLVLAVASHAQFLNTSSAMATPPLPIPNLDCDPCINRPTYRVRAITHGNRNGGLFWHQVRAAAMSAAQILRIELQFDLYEEFDPHQMALDILSAVHSPTPPNALLVTIPSPIVHEAITEALQAGIPVFGMNSGSDVAEQLGLLGFLAMDEYQGGVAAAEQFWNSKGGNIQKALFVDQERGNSALQARLQGFNTTLHALNQQSNHSTRLDVNVFYLDPAAANQTEQVLEEAFQECPYDAILLGGASSMEVVQRALYHSGCKLSKEGTLLGTFDTSTSVYNDLAVGKLHFAISQQQHLQGMLGVVFATLYATTQKRLLFTNTTSAPLFSTGPKVLTLKNLPADTLQACEEEAFPVCPHTLDVYGKAESKCACTDLSQFTIAAVLHGINTHPFWLGLVAQTKEAAADLGINLELHLQEALNDEDIIFAKMANKIQSLCRQGVHGMVVSIPSEAVVEAIQECQRLQVPVMSVNSGAEIAYEIGMMHHIGQIEYNAGYEAGQRMMALGMKQAMCPYESGNIGLVMRCSGFRDAIMDANTTAVEWLGMPVLTVGGFDYASVYIRTVEQEVERLNAQWDGLGILLGASMFVEYSLVLKENHPDILIGTFDKEEIVYETIASGDVLFGIDQGDYLQGYLPIWLLTINAYTSQFLQDRYLASGPTFIDKPQPANAIQCEDDQFKVCPPPINHDYNRITNFRPVGLTLMAIVWVTSFFFLLWTMKNKKHAVLAVSQPTFLAMLTLGTIVMSSAIIPLSIDDGIASVDQCSKACMAVPWLFTMGFTITFAVLFIKIWRVNQLMQNARRFRRAKVTALHVMLPLIIMVVANVVLMLVWTVVDPMYWTRKSGDCGDENLSSYGTCQLGRKKVSAVLFGCVICVNFSALILALVEAYKARDISDALSERKYLFWNFGGMLQVGMIGIPLIALVSQDPVASYFVKSALLFVVCMSTLLLIFIPKLKNWRLGLSHEQLTVSRPRGSTMQKYSGEADASVRANYIPSDWKQSRESGEAPAVNRSGVLNHSRLKSDAETESLISDKTVPLDKILALEKHMKEQGIDTRALFAAVELESLLMPEKSTRSLFDDEDGEVRDREEAPPIENDGEIALFEDIDVGDAEEGNTSPQLER